MGMKRFVKALAALAVLAVVLVGCGSAKLGSGFKFGTGDKGGKYYLYGTKFAQAISSENKKLTFKIKKTAGSAANLRLLGDGFLDVAIVQSDMLSDALQGTGMFEKTGPKTGFAPLAGLYTEVCQIVVSDASEIRSVYDLAGKRISLGDKETGGMQNALQILAAHGLGEEMVEPVHLSFTRSAAALERGEIEAFFCTAGTPTKAIADLGKKIPIRLLAIPPEIMQYMMGMDSGYTSCSIPAGTYPGQTEDIPTLGVKAVLVASTSVSDADVEEMTKFLFIHGDKWADAVGLPNELDPEYATSDIPGGFHAGAANYYKTLGMEVPIYEGPEAKRPNAKQD